MLARFRPTDVGRLSDKWRDTFSSLVRSLPYLLNEVHPHVDRDSQIFGYRPCPYVESPTRTVKPVEYFEYEWHLSQRKPMRCHTPAYVSHFVVELNLRQVDHANCNKYCVSGQTRFLRIHPNTRNACISASNISRHLAELKVLVTSSITRIITHQEKWSLSSAFLTT